MINEKRLVDLFLRLITVSTPAKHELPVAEMLRPMLEELGFSVEEDDAGSRIGGTAGNLIAYKQGKSNTGHRIFFSAHMDTVAPTDKLTPRISDGVIHTGGESILGADDKAGIAAIVEAMRVVEEQDIPYRSIQVLFDVAEEIGLMGAKNLSKDRIRADFGYVFDTEKPVASLVVAAPSHENIRVRFIGKAAHAGIRPESGVSAIVAASKAIASMRLGRVDEETTANVGVIKGGQARNIIPDEVEVLAEARSRSEDKLARQVEHMVRCFHDAAHEVGAGVDIEVAREYESYRFTHEHLVVKMGLEAGRRIGIEPQLVEGGGGSDANVFNSYGLPAVVVGVGYENAHSSAESIAVSDLVACARYVVALVEASTEL
jgi:tripeptide aminopeptidase